MVATVADMIARMAAIASPALAETWDNPGLQVGDPARPVRLAWVALDPLPEVVDAACRAGAQLLITHHPLIFKPLSRIHLTDPIGRIIEQALSHHLAIYSAHTNLDSVHDGLNDWFAERIGLKKTRPLVPATGKAWRKFAVFVPRSHEAILLDALAAAGAGRIGNYAGCSFRHPGTGRFTPLAGSHPAAGVPGQASDVDEIRIEALIPAGALASVVERLRRVHPYETMAYDAYPVDGPETDDGIGRIGTLPQAATLERLAADVCRALGLDGLRTVGDPGLPVSRVAVCTGSGGSLLGDVLACGADAYVSGDIKYHEARAVQAAGKGLIDIGHFASEHIVVEALAKRLAEAGADLDPPVQVFACDIETDPFVFRFFKSVAQPPA